jgi:hypothetical protein
MTVKKPNLTVTDHYLHQKKARYVIESPIPTIPIPINRRPLGRLSWTEPTGKFDWSAENLGKTIEQSSLPDALVFADTNVFTTPLDDVAWRAILTRKLVITPWVRRELQAWLENPRCNAEMRDRVARTAEEEHSSICFDEVDPKMRRHGYEYYVNFLALRKHIGVVEQGQHQLESPLGVHPKDGLAGRAAHSRVCVGQQIIEQGEKPVGTGGPHRRDGRIPLLTALVARSA